VPDLLDAALEDLEADLARIKQLTSFVKSLREFGGIGEHQGAVESAFITKAIDVRTIVRALGSDIPVLSGTLLLFLAGRFEHFVRMSFQSHCDTIGQKCKTFSQLPEKMQQSLRYFTAEVCLSPSKYGFDEIEALGFMVGLAGNVSATDGLGSINSACLSVTQNNINPSILADIYKRIGIQALWNDLSKQAPLKAYLEVDKDSDAERAAKGRLEDLMTTRNQIAHPTGSPAFPGPEKVDTYIEYVAILARTLTAISRVHIAAFKPVARLEIANLL
jgi:hypothetical protein